MIENASWIGRLLIVLGFFLFSLTGTIVPITLGVGILLATHLMVFIQCVFGIIMIPIIRANQEIVEGGLEALKESIDDYNKNAIRVNLTRVCTVGIALMLGWLSLTIPGLSMMFYPDAVLMFFSLFTFITKDFMIYRVNLLVTEE